MLINTNSSKEAQAERDLINTMQLQAEIEMIIRKRFNGAATTLEAQSWVNIAEHDGLYDLAAELGNDLRNDINVNLN